MKDVSEQPGNYKREFAAILTAAAVLCWAALYNGFPMVFSDTNSFIGALGPAHMHWARPIFYGIFVRLTSLSINLWSVILAQALIVAWTLSVAMRAAFGEVRTLPYLGTVIVLAGLTSLPWIVGELMPDVFTGLVILCLFILGFGSARLSRIEILAISGIVTAGIAFHLSHIPLAAGVGLAIVVLQALARPFRNGLARRALLLAGPVVLATAAHLLVNIAVLGQVSVSPASSMFLLARLQADGPATTFLKETCPERHWSLCPWIDRLPLDVTSFLWRDESPLYAAGGPRKLIPEAREIVRGTVAHYPLQVAGVMATNAIRQAGAFASFDGFEQKDIDSAVHRTLKYMFPHQFQAHMQSRQMTDRLPVPLLRPLHTAVAALGMVATVVFGLVFLRRGDLVPAAFALVVLLGYLGNAAITGATSGVYDRYASRAVWLFVFYTVAAGWRLAAQRPVVRKPMLEQQPSTR